MTQRGFFNLGHSTENRFLYPKTVQKTLFYFSPELKGKNEKTSPETGKVLNMQISLKSGNKYYLTRFSSTSELAIRHSS